MIVNGNSNPVNDRSLEERERNRRIVESGPAHSDKLVRDAIHEDVVKAEELERQRRVAEMGYVSKLSELEPRSDVPLSEVKELEEEERSRRILQDEIADKIGRLGGMTKKQVIEAEEQERAERIREQDLPSHVFAPSELPLSEVHRAEEIERQRRITEDKFIDQLESRPQMSLEQVHQAEEIERARRIQEDKIIDEVRSRSSLSKDEVIRAEERERQRRIAEDKIIDEVRSRPSMSWDQVNDLEERERQRRINEDEIIDKVWSKPDLSRDEVVALEEKERARRITENIMIDFQSNPTTSRREVIAMEEEERQRRIAEDTLDLEKEHLRSKFDLIATKKMEEAERQRRISEDARDDALLEGSRKLAGAQVHILEELERSRRIAEDKQIDDNLHEQSLRNRELSKQAEEQERNRRVADIERKKLSPDYSLAHVVPAFVPELLNKVQASESASNLSRAVPAELPSNLPAASNLPASNLPATTANLPTASLPTASFASKRIIAVLGGTGLQGSSVIKSLLADGNWTVRTLTRNASSPKALQLAQSGVQVFQGNMHLDSDLSKLFAGVYGVFAVTNFWDPQTAGKETQLGINIARLAKANGVKHYVWSTLPNAEKLSGGKFKIPHFTGKAQVNSTIKSLGFEAYTFVVPSFYFQNFSSIFAPKQIDGKLEWTFPMEENSVLSAFDVNDMGMVVSRVFNNKEQFNKSKLNLVSESMKPQDYFINMSLVTKISTRVHLLSPQNFSKLYKLQPEMVEMLSYFQEFGYFGKTADTLNPRKNLNLTGWAQYLQQESAPNQMVQAD